MTPNNTSVIQKNYLKKPKSTNNIKNRSRSNSRKRFSENLDNHLDPIKHIFDNVSQTGINFLQFKYVIENITTSEHPLDSIHGYGTTGKHILTILEMIRPFLSSNIAKNNLTRISNKLFKVTENEDHTKELEIDSDTNSNIQPQ